MSGETSEERKAEHAEAKRAPVRLDVLLLLNRLALGWYLLLAGWNKIEAEWEEGAGTFYRGDSFQSRAAGWLPEFIAAPYGFALPWLEFIFGLLLLVGLFGRTTAIVVTFIFVTIGIALLGAGDLLPRHHVMVFLPLALLFAVLGPGRYSVDRLIRKR